MYVFMGKVAMNDGFYVVAVHCAVCSASQTCMKNGHQMQFLKAEYFSPEKLLLLNKYY